MAFLYILNATVASIFPSAAVRGSQVALYGSNIDTSSASRVLFGTEELVPDEVDTDYVLFTVPTSYSGAAQVVVRRSNYHDSFTPTSALFTVQPEANLTSLSPTSVPTSTGVSTLLTVSGFNLSMTAEDTLCRFGVDDVTTRLLLGTLRLHTRPTVLRRTRPTPPSIHMLVFTRRFALTARSR